LKEVSPEGRQRLRLTHDSIQVTIHICRQFETSIAQQNEGATDEQEIWIP
jgi:hypothetical protein